MKISDKKIVIGKKRREIGRKDRKAGKLAEIRLMWADVQRLRPAGWYSTLILLIFLIFVIFAQRYTRQLAATQAGRQAPCNG